MTGTAAGPADCTWLNTAIKTLSIGVILVRSKCRREGAPHSLTPLQPAADNLDIINAITIKQATFLFTEEDPWNPRFSTNNTVGVFQLPFALPVSRQLASRPALSDASFPAGRHHFHLGPQIFAFLCE